MLSSATATALPAFTEPASSSATSAVVVKLSLRGETFRITFAQSDLTWRAICSKVHDCYADAHRPSLWTLVYRDNEEDLVTVSSELEFEEACRVFAELKEQPTHHQKLHMHFYVVTRLTLKEQLAPVMQVVGEISEKMTRLASDTRESLRKSSYVERGRESIYGSAVHTRDAISSAGRGLSQRMRRASTAVAGEISEIRRRTRTRSRVSSSDMVEETSPLALFATNVETDQGDRIPEELHNMADLLAQARAEEDEAERLALEEAQPTATSEAATVDEVTSVEEPREVIATAPIEEQDDHDHASDAETETESTASDDTACEWDFLPASSSISSSVHLDPSFEVDEDDDETETAFSRWGEQLRTIRDIMPRLDVAFCVGVLDKHNGNLEATLVELTEM